jgi:hypothetical protein
MATTRLRRTFRYPHDSDSDDPPDLDEEHQEALLTSIQTADEKTSTLYRHLFLALPTLTALAYIPTLFSATTTAQRFTALLSVIVPALAAYALYFYPIKVPGSHGVKSLYVNSGRNGAVKPTERHLIVLGASLSVMLGLVAGMAWREGKGADGWGVCVPAGESFLLFLHSGY